MTIILFVDNGEMHRNGFASILNANYKVDFAKSGKIALDYLKRNSYDLAVVDFQMEEMNGHELAREIQTNFPGVKIIAYTQHDVPDVIIPFHEMGVEGILLKDDHPEEIRTALNSIINGRPYKSRRALEVIVNTQKKNLCEVTITPRQKQVLQLIGNGMEDKEIALALGIDFSSIRTHYNALRDKLNAKNRTDLGNKGRDLGLID